MYIGVCVCVCVCVCVRVSSVLACMNVSVGVSAAHHYFKDEVLKMLVKPKRR